MSARINVGFIPEPVVRKPMLAEWLPDPHRDGFELGAHAEFLQDIVGSTSILTQTRRPQEE
jgi:hypothetical protein